VREQLDALVGIADSKPMLEVFGIGSALGQLDEVAFLKFLDPLENGRIVKELSGVLKAQDVLVQLVDNVLRIRLRRLVNRSETARVFGRKVEKSKARRAFSFVHSKLIDEAHAPAL
jgi:hypothetical protein